MDRKKRILMKLKPKVKQFGFNKKELMSVAARIADNLTSADDASDEDVDAEIDKAIEDALPYLQFGQSYANRVIEENRISNDENNDDADDEPNDDDDEPATGKPSKRQQKPKKDKNGKDDSDALKKLLDKIDALTNEVSSMKTEKLASGRKDKLKELLKDSGKYGESIMKSFAKMKFENDEEFDEYYSEVEEDLKAYNQERADAGLSTLGNPPAGSKGGKAKEDEPMTDEEIEALSAMG